MEEQLRSLTIKIGNQFPKKLNDLKFEFKYNEEGFNNQVSTMGESI